VKERERAMVLAHHFEMAQTIGSGQRRGRSPLDHVRSRRRRAGGTLVVSSPRAEDGSRIPLREIPRLRLAPSGSRASVPVPRARRPARRGCKTDRTHASGPPRGLLAQCRRQGALHEERELPSAVRWRHEPSLHLHVKRGDALCDRTPGLPPRTARRELQALPRRLLCCLPS